MIRKTYEWNPPEIPLDGDFYSIPDLIRTDQIRYPACHMIELLILSYRCSSILSCSSVCVQFSLLNLILPLHIIRLLPGSTIIFIFLRGILPELHFFANRKKVFGVSLG